MQYFDRNTDPSRYPDDVGALVQAMLQNRQLFGEGQADPSFVTSALKYARQRQQRRQTSRYEGDDAFVQSIIDMFDFDPLDFQVESWQTIETLDTARRAEGQQKAAVLSAPTGFGKTEAFLGPLYQLLRDGTQNGAAIVYPSRALLQDQLGRMLEHIHQLDEGRGESLSIGIYMGGQPWEMEDVSQEGLFERGTPRPRFKLANCWCGSNTESHAFEYHGTRQGYTLQCEADDTHRFTDRELMLARQPIVRDRQPDILLTTLESLEGFALKPNYPLIDHIDTIVLDEVHLYTQLRGAHAANILRNVADVSSEPLLWLGSSATIDDPQRFGARIFGIEDQDDIVALEPPESDFDDRHDDTEHYYFLKTPEDGPGVSSMAIQQYMLLGHTLLDDGERTRSKMLSFIDSISQVNQKDVQLTNADVDRRLWQYHAGSDDVEDWPAVAAAMDRSFIDEPLSSMRVYSDEGFDSDRAAAVDHLLSTNFLEVGIDVGDIQVITQYRTPWNLSSFLQRAGRAAREPGTDSHIAVFLSSLTDDANMFYRAERFLGSEIRTPLKVDNPVVEWIHERLNQYYRRAKAARETHGLPLETHKAFLEGYLGDDLGYPPAVELVLEPAAFFESAFDEEIGVPSEPLLAEQPLAETRAALHDHLDGLHEEFADIEQYFGMDDGNVVRGADAVDTYIIEVQTRVLDLINTLSGQVSGYNEVLHDNDIHEHDSLVASLDAALDDARERASSIPDGEPAAKVEHFSNIVPDLFIRTGEIQRLQNTAHRAADRAIEPVDTDQLNDVNSAVEQLAALGSDERLKRFYNRQKQVYYLQQALDELEEYATSTWKPYLSVYAIKPLLRSVYYIDRYLRTVDAAPDATVWFVPPDYFGGSGRVVTVFEGENDQRGSQESIDQLVSTYTPYRSEYQGETGSMQAFLPGTEVDGDSVVFDFDQHVTGEKRDGLLIPDSMRLSTVDDLSDEQAHNIVRYCPVCYQILPDSRCLRHDESALGKIHAEARVDTTVSDRHVDESEGRLALADLSAAVTLQGVTLDISPASYRGPEVGYLLDSEADRREQRIESPPTPLGFQLDTRGLVFELDAFEDELATDIRAWVERYNDLEEVDFEYLVHHTAAHFFLQLVADVSSVNTTTLLYGFDTAKQEVYVFERTEGGQGIVDLVFNELRADPASVLEALNRIAYNPQVIAERLWADQEFVSDLPADARAEGDVRPVVAAYVPSPFDDVVDQVVQDVLSTVDQCRRYAQETAQSTAAVYSLKQVVAGEQVGGADEFPEQAVEQAGVDEERHDRVKSLFYSPDVDGCVENLQLHECIASGDQSETLSYVVVEALRNHLTDSVQTSDAATEMFAHEHPPAAELDGTSIFLNF
jgi:superfamily II DNA or RNA helicase